MISDLRGRIALVTGCSGGIGLAVCEALSEAGAQVIGADLARQPPQPLPGDVRYRTLDVTSEEGWREVLSVIEAEYDGLDILVNNAGLVLVKTLAETTLEDWRRVTQVNVEGVFLGCKLAAPLLRKAGGRTPFGSAIVNLSSVAGLGGGPLYTAYCASKGAVRLFTKACAMEFAALKANIRVNSVHPGGVQSPMMDHILQRYVEAGLSPDTKTARAATLAAHPLGRIAEADEIAKAIRFLASDEAGFMTGAELVVDGGFTAH